MKTAKIFKAFALSALLLAGSAGAVLAQERDELPQDHKLVSGIPYDGFLKGSLVPANGPRYTDEVVTEGPSVRFTVERDSIRQNDLSLAEVAALSPEAIIGLGWTETDEDAEELIALAMGQ